MARNIRFFNIYDNQLKNTTPDAVDLNINRVLDGGRTAGQFPKWFDIVSGRVIYITCGALELYSLSGDHYYLVWPHSQDVEVKAHWDEDKNEIIVDYARAVKHIALYCGDKVTLLKTWAISNAVNVKPKIRYWAEKCPGDNTIIGCYNIPRLPRLGTDDELAPKSTEMFDVCVDIPSLPLLV